MGTPSATEPWGWQLDGHHAIVNYFVLGDQVVMTPHFYGSEPVRAESGKYKGTDLVYSRGALGFDPSTANATYRVGSNMTGGSSGGPWFAPFSAGSGTMISVNSYGYSGITAMHGPKLNAETESMFAEAESATANIIVP